MVVKKWANLFVIATVLSFPAYTGSTNQRLIVRFKEGVSSFASDSVHRTLGIRTHKKLNKLIPIEVVNLPGNISIQKAIKFYKNNPNVLYAEPDFKIKVSPIEGDVHQEAQDPFSQQWALDNRGQRIGRSIGKAGADIRALKAWELTKGDRNVVLGIIDTGVFYKHPDLKDNVWNNPNEVAGNGEDDDGNGYIDDVHGINAVDRSGDPLDDNGHGTHVAGIIGGTNANGKGVFGINQKVSIVACKFLNSEGEGDMSDALVCMDYFAKLKTREKNPVDVTAINASWGGGPFSQAMFDAIKGLKDLGIILVAAAGNDGENNDSVDSFPANYQLPNVISVAATDNKDALAYFSNYGLRSVHVSAPGVDIMSTYLNDGYEIFSGTSMATPYVTGMLGLIKAKDASLDWKALKNLVVSAGTSLTVLSQKTLSGRRLRGADKDGVGSLTCSKQRISNRILPVKDSVSIKLGESVDFSILKVECDSADVAPVMTVDMGHAVDFTDSEETGVYQAKWTPDSVGTYVVDLGDAQKVTVTVSE